MAAKHGQDSGLQWLLIIHKVCLCYNSLKPGGISTFSRNGITKSQDNSVNTRAIETSLTY